MNSGRGTAIVNRAGALRCVANPGLSTVALGAE